MNHFSVALTHSIKLAEIFKAEIAITYFPVLKKGETPPITRELIDETYSGSIPYKIIEWENRRIEPNYSIQQLDAIFLVTQFPLNTIDSTFKINPVFNWISKAKIPSIVLSANTNSISEYKNVFVPIDFRKESKEKMIWASYFGRFNQAVIHLLTPNEKSESLQRTIRASLLFTKKMFQQFSFEYKIIQNDCYSKYIYQKAIQLSKEMNSDILIMMADSNPGWFTSIFGPTKLKKILREEKNPVLFINPLKDYYLPCN